jgi:AcrR family transcriptional regulator
MTEDSPTPKLDRERILAAAVDLADEIGLQGFTIRRLATALDAGPMTIYHYLPSKEAIIDGMVDSVFTEIDLPPTDGEWTAAIRARCISARRVLNRHPWAPPVMESRTNPGPATLRHHDAVIACLLGGGLSIQLTAHAYAVLDSYLYGFTLEEAQLPGSGGAEMTDMAREMGSELAAEYPSLNRLEVEHVLQPGYSFGDSFEFGLDLILDGFKRAAQAELSR